MAAVKIIMHGCNGKMGRVITSIVEQDSAVTIVAGVDPFGGVANEYPVYSTIKECTVDADVIIDFSNASAVDGLIDYAVDRQIPLVLFLSTLSPA